VVCRPVRVRDAAALSAVRLVNRAWLEQWEPTSDEPWEARNAMGPTRRLLRDLRRRARAGTHLPFVVETGGRVVGQVTVNNVVRGSLRSGYLGYWVDSRCAGQGVCPTAVALVTDHCFGPLGLHRVEADVRPENAASRRVVEKLGFREEGLHRRFLHIGGDWRDHVIYALTAEEVPGGVLARWQGTRGTTTE
jgi:[ribosomal protein S5]-alanine N-acetyltransferase